MVTLGVNDLGRMRAFYEALGWSERRQPDNEVAFYQAGGWSSAYGPRSRSRRPRDRVGHNVRSPAEVDSLLTDVVRAGGTITRPAARAEWVANGAFADPKGMSGIAHNPDWALASDGSVRLR